MKGKVCLVTGSTSGIGTVTARELARDGATTVLHCRKAQQGEALAADIRAETGNPDVHVVVGDFASLAAVRSAAEDVLARFPRLHVLVNNAGAIQMDRATTQEGFELTFGVNHLAPFLFTNLLLERIRASAPARIVNVSSRAHYRSRLDLDDLERRGRYDGWQAYCDSKLCNVLFTVELARRLTGTGVTANCLHPGVIRSGFGKNRPGLFNLGVRIAGLFMWTPEQGAQTSLKLARDPSVEGLTGRYFDDDGTERRPSRLARDPALATRLWEMSEKLVGLAG